MTNLKMTKRALLTSVMALMLCFAMLTGTTFAWFTDQETSANNKIIAGNLDVELYHQGANDAEAIKVNSATADLFQDVTPEKWEPGAIAYETFTIKNVGNIAFKYDFTMSVGNATVIDGHSFADMLKVTVVEGDFAPTGRIDTSEYTWTGFENLTKIGKLYPADYATDMTNYSTNDVYTIIVWWEPSDIDNVFNTKDTVSAEFRIQLFATQLDAEVDAFGPDYDKDSTFPVIGTVTKEDGVASAVKASNVVANIPANAPAGEYTLDVSNKKVTADDVSGETTVSFNIELNKDGVKVEATSGILYTVEIEVGKNLDVTGVTHNGTAVQGYSYDPVAGIVTFTTDSFSPFAVTYKVADDNTVFAPADPEAAEKLEKDNVVAVDENGNEYTSFVAAVKSGASKLYFKEGVDLGSVTHVDVANDLVIYGNGAYISGGERDLAIDTYVKLEKDITVTVYNLHGVAFWGQRNTAYTANLNLYNCNDIGRVYINGTTGVNNIALYNCTASSGNDVSYKNLVGDTVVYSNANGSVLVDGCTITNIGCPVNLNHKIAGEQTVTVTNTKFVDCSTSGTAAYYAPIRVYNSAEGANQTLTVAGNTFAYSESKAPVNKADVLLNAKHNGADALGTIKANIQISANVVSGVNVDFNYTISNVDDFIWFAAEVNDGAEYEGNTYAGNTILLTADIDFDGAEWTPIGYFGNTSKQFNGVFDGQGHVVSNFQITKKSPDREGKNRSSIGFFGNVNGTIKNLTIAEATVKVTDDGRFVGGIIGRLNGGLVENCQLVDSYVEGNAWQIGGIVGQANAGTIQQCDVKNTTVVGKAGVAAIAGFQVDAKELNINNCTVEKCTIAQEGSYGEGYDDMFAAVIGCLNNSKATVVINNCSVKNTTVKGVDSSALYGYIEAGAKLTVDGVEVVVVDDADSLVSALKNGGIIVLGADIAMPSVAISGANFVLNGNGYTITLAEGATNTYALMDITGGTATIKNVTFDGIKGGAIVRTVDVDATIDNITAINGEHTQAEGLLRLLGKSTVTNSTFKNNTCNMVITLNFDADSNNYHQTVNNCVFEGNTCNDTAVVYYVCGSGFTFDGNKIVGNTVSSKGNAASVYLGFKKNCVVTNNLFEDNAVATTHATTKRATGGLMVGNEAIVTGNAFIGNTITAEGRTLGNDVCASVYYADIDLSGNYWGGSAPVENDDYFVEYPDSHKVIINDYLTSFEG